MNKIRIGKEQAIQRIRHFCAYQERAQQEVRDKLYELGMTKSEVEEILSNLITDNFLNEWGKSKIQYALQQKRVSPVNIKKALKSIDLDDYNTTLLFLAKKKWNSLKGERGLSRMAKTQAFLYQRGFESALIQPILQQLNKAK